LKPPRGSIRLEAVAVSDAKRGFVLPLPRRWVVERSSRGPPALRAKRRKKNDINSLALFP